MTDGFPYVVWYCDYYEDYLSELSNYHVSITINMFVNV